MLLKKWNFGAAEISAISFEEFAQVLTHRERLTPNQVKTATTSSIFLTNFSWSVIIFRKLHANRNFQRNVTFDSLKFHSDPHISTKYNDRPFLVIYSGNTIISEHMCQISSTQRHFSCEKSKHSGRCRVIAKISIFHFYCNLTLRYSIFYPLHTQNASDIPNNALKHSSHMYTRCLCPYIRFFFFFFFFISPRKFVTSINKLLSELNLYVAPVCDVTWPR